MPRSRRRRIVWSSSDVKLLHQLAGRQSVDRIARKLKRTVLAVRFKAHINGISLAVRHSR